MRHRYKKNGGIDDRDRCRNLASRILEKFAGGLAKDFKEFILVTGMNHVRTSPDYPQSNCQIKRWQGGDTGKIWLTSTRTITDFARMPEISGVPAYPLTRHLKAEWHPTRVFVVVGRCSLGSDQFRRPLQYGPTEQRHRLRCKIEINRF